MTADNMTHFCLVILVVALSAYCTDGRVCTRVASESKIQTVSYPGECMRSFQDRCGWFSSKTCTFNETVPCMKQMNHTVNIYRIIEDCCPGYRKIEGGQCIDEKSSSDPDSDSYSDSDDYEEIPETGNETLSSNSKEEDRTNKNSSSHSVSYTVKADGSKGKPTQTGKAVPYETDDSLNNQQSDNGLSVTVGDFHDSTEENEKIGQSRGSSKNNDDSGFANITHGAYAGIVCGVLFVVCVALLIALHYRKRNKRQVKLQINLEQEVTQKQAMIPLDTVNASNSPTMNDPPGDPPVNT